MLHASFLWRIIHLENLQINRPILSKSSELKLMLCEW